MSRVLTTFCGIVILSALLAADEEADVLVEAPLSSYDREHWAYRPLSQPEIPKVEQAGWLRTPVDAFVLAQLEARGLSAGWRADNPTLLRRVSFDLTGLPPTIAEQAAFLEDHSPDAWERLIDRLLDSPAYGERWAQHWLDLARFADTDGFEFDKVRPDAWRYRDWVIDALNRDLPYDEFLRQQLAGDELPGGDAVATMFCLAGPDMPDVNDEHERRHFRLNELTGTVGAVFLGMQIGCAECHDHKSDPISQADFYRLRAVFEPSVPEMKRDVAYHSLANHDQPVVARLWIRGDHRRPGPEVEPGVPRIAVAEGVTLDIQEQTGSRTALAESLLVDAQPLVARVIVNRLWQHHFGRGLCATPSDFGLINEEPSHPELIDWLARDLIAHGWSLKHLHRRIVCSATYRQTSRSMRDDRDWHQRLAQDPDNRWLSRSPRRRLDGESLRDALLAAAGQLNRDRGGPGVMPPLPEELVQTLLKGQWTTSEKTADHTRRSIYLFARRNLRYPLLESFDRPDANASCAVRNRSTTAPQALGLLNSELSVNVARRLAGLVLASASEPEEQIELLYQRTLTRRATDEDVALVRQFLDQQRTAFGSEGLQGAANVLPSPVPAGMEPRQAAAWVDLCLAILNSNEFLYCD